eukprot:g2899.t1
MATARLGERLKVLVLVGATAVGKTKLSVQLAKALNAEIVNGDALQVYRGLDIATAKVTEKEKCGVPHHLFSFLDPKSSITVREYRDRALQVIEDISSRGKLPIIVGGTTYYIQSLLWPSLLDEETDMLAGSKTQKGTESCAVATKETTHSNPLEELKRVDPQMAERLHPNERRKIEHSLRIFRETGIQHSKLIAEQHSRDAAMQPRYECRAIWLDCDLDVHEARLSARIGTMVDQGLLEEVESLWDMLENDPDMSSKTSHDEDASSGLRQAIGFKEFFPWLALPKPRSRCVTFTKEGTCAVSSTVVAKETESARVLSECLELLRVRTRQYSRRQTKWLRNRFANRNVQVTRLNTSNVELWDQNVLQPALDIGKKLLAGDKIPEDEQREMNERNRRFWASRDISKWKKRACDVCGITTNGEHEWNTHLSSRRHRKRLANLERRRKREEEGGLVSDKAKHFRAE